MENDVYCGGDVILFRPSQQVEPRYLGYAMDCRPTAAQKATMGRGITVMHIYGNQLKYLTFPLPPLPEQIAIVRFLDHADRRIRRYIRAKQKLIALLEEQKQAIIHQAVTGQIDVRTGEPYPSYKDSGVEWLGGVPMHWDVRKLKHLTRFHNGLAFKPSDWSTDGVPIIRIQNLNGSDDFNYTVREDLPDFLLIRPGDLEIVVPHSDHIYGIGISLDISISIFSNWMVTRSIVVTFRTFCVRLLDMLRSRPMVLLASYM